MTDIRCQHKKHAEIVGGKLEVKCSSRFCGAGSGVVVIHVYDPADGTLLDTRRYREVTPIQKEVKNGARRHSTSVRSS